MLSAMSAIIAHIFSLALNSYCACTLSAYRLLSGWDNVVDSLNNVKSKELETKQCFDERVEEKNIVVLDVEVEVEVDL